MGVLPTGVVVRHDGTPYMYLYECGRLRRVLEPLPRLTVINEWVTAWYGLEEGRRAQ